MKTLKQKLAQFQESKPGLYLKKWRDDQAPNLASLLAWGTLSTLVPLLLGVVAVGGLVLRDPERVDQLYGMLAGLIPSQANGVLDDALSAVRTGGAQGAGIFGLGLLLFNGSRFFSNMATIFDRAYHVESRNFFLQILVSIVMLVIVTSLLVVSTVALGLGAVIGSLPTALPGGEILGRVISWAASFIAAFVIFVLLYKVLPNVKQGWRNVLPGAALSAVLFMAITALFPLYLTFFPPNDAYATFGLFLVLTFWLYLWGLILVTGAELNAFLLQPGRSAAIAEAAANADKGKVSIRQQGDEVQVQSDGDAPALSGADDRAPTAHPTETKPDDSSAPSAQPRPRPSQPRPVQREPETAGTPSRGGAGGKLVGLLALAFAMVVDRRSKPKKAQEAQAGTTAV